MRVSTHHACVRTCRVWKFFFFFCANLSSPISRVYICACTCICVCVRVRVVPPFSLPRLFFSPPPFLFFGVLGHEGVSRKTRTLEQAECGSSREVIIRVHESLAAWLLPHPTTYIHIYTAAAQKQCVRNITQHTYLGETAWEEKGTRRHGRICHCRRWVSLVVMNKRRIEKGKRKRNLPGKDPARQR